MMVPLPVAVAMLAPPVGLLSVTVNDSLPSAMLSWMLLQILRGVSASGSQGAPSFLQDAQGQQDGFVFGHENLGGLHKTSYWAPLGPRVCGNEKQGLVRWASSLLRRVRGSKQGQQRR